MVRIRGRGKSGKEVLEIVHSSFAIDDFWTKGENRVEKPVSGLVCKNEFYKKYAWFNWML